MRCPSGVVAHQVVTVMRKLCLAWFVQSHGDCMSLGISITFPGTSFLTAFDTVNSTHWDRSPLVASPKKAWHRQSPFTQDIHLSIAELVTPAKKNHKKPSDGEVALENWYFNTEGPTAALSFWLSTLRLLGKSINSELFFSQSEKVPVLGLSTIDMKFFFSIFRWFLSPICKVNGKYQLTEHVFF